MGAGRGPAARGQLPVPRPPPTQAGQYLSRPIRTFKKETSWSKLLVMNKITSLSKEAGI